jgi:lipase ATG15
MLRDHQTLRHILFPGAHTHDRIDLVHGDGSNAIHLPQLLASSQDTAILRLSYRQSSRLESLLRNAQIQGHRPGLNADEWALEHVPGPNVSDKQTVLNLAAMASDAYALDPADPVWHNLTGGFNRSQSFGWQSYGIRGHIFADEDNSTIVIATKGTHEGQLLVMN